MYVYPTFFPTPTALLSLFSPWLKSLSSLQSIFEFRQLCVFIQPLISTWTFPLNLEILGLSQNISFGLLAKYWKPEIRKSLKLIKYDWTILLSGWLLLVQAGWALPAQNCY